MATPDIELTLLSNAAATGAAVTLSRGGLFCFAVSGTWDGATAKLQMLSPSGGTTYIDVGADATFTANGACLAELPAGSYRVAISSGPPSAMYATLKEVRRYL